MIRRHLTAIACALPLGLGLAGCGHGHDHHDDAHATGTAAQLSKDQDEAADAVIAHARSYIDAREKAPDKVAAKGAIGAKEFALETLIDAAAAYRVAGRAEDLAEDVDVDPGRAARVKNAASLLRRAAQVAANQAKATLRSGDDTALKTDAAFLRAMLRALKVDLNALDREARE